MPGQSLVLYNTVLVQGSDDMLRMALNDATLSIIILDASMSMTRYRDTPVEAVNEHFRSLRNSLDGREQYCALITFSDTARVEKPITQATQLTPFDSYEHSSGTRLWQTVDEIIFGFLEMYKAVPSRPRQRLKIVIGVFSDGEDSKSPRPLYPPKLQHTSQEAIEAGFALFAYGIGIDAQKLAQDMGFPCDAEHAVAVLACKEGIHRATRHFTHSTMMFGGKGDKNGTL